MRKEARTNLMFEMIPDELKELNQWVVAMSDSKIPITPYTGFAASCVNPDTWSDYETAAALVENHIADNIGFVFDDNGLVGIDIDVGYTEDGFISPLGADIIGKCASYCEKSRSGRGFHILLRGELPFKGRNNLKGVEIYKSARYFIMTGNTILYKTIEENQAAIDYVIKKYFSDVREEKAGALTCGKIYTPLWEPPKDNMIKLRPTYPKINKGSRNISLTSLAGAMHNQGYTKRQIYDELIYANKMACNPPLGEGELMSICNSVTRYKR